MASFKPVPPLDPPKDLARCGICNEIINHPKALHCLHTFCLECLREWSKPNKETVTCPVLHCKKTTPMPSNGVDGLPGNVFVSSLIDTRWVFCCVIGSYQKSETTICETTAWKPPSARPLEITICGIFCDCTADFCQLEVKT